MNSMWADSFCAPYAHPWVLSTALCRIIAEELGFGGELRGGTCEKSKRENLGRNAAYGGCLPNAVSQVRNGVCIWWVKPHPPHLFPPSAGVELGWPEAGGGSTKYRERPRAFLLDTPTSKSWLCHLLPMGCCVNNITSQPLKVWIVRQRLIASLRALVPAQ